MLYTKKDLKFLRKQSNEKLLGKKVREYYQRCVDAIEKNGMVDTRDVRDDGDE